MKWLKQMRQIVKTRLYTKRHRVTELGITQNNINHWLKPVARFGSLSKQLSQWRQQRDSHSFAYLMRKTMISARSASTCRACRVWKLCTRIFHFDEFLWLRRWKDLCLGSLRSYDCSCTENWAFVIMCSRRQQNWKADHFKTSAKCIAMKKFHVQSVQNYWCHCKICKFEMFCRRRGSLASYCCISAWSFHVEDRTDANSCQMYKNEKPLVQSVQKTICFIARYVNFLLSVLVAFDVILV